jgi:hypothetical protein
MFLYGGYSQRFSDGSYEYKLGFFAVHLLFMGDNDSRLGSN